jgi:hypothetical protein
MKKTTTLLLAALLMAMSTSASAFWRDRYNDSYYDYNDWPVFTPMYWMEEFMDEFDNDRYGNRGWGNRGFGNRGYRGYPPYGGYGYPQRGYGAPYGGYAPYYAPAQPPRPAQ